MEKIRKERGRMGTYLNPGNSGFAEILQADYQDKTGMIDLINERINTPMLMYGKEASNRKQEIDRQHYTIPNQRPKDKHCGKI